MKGTYNDGLILPELIPGRLIKRYKRFLAEVQLETGDVVTAHCPNTGAMTACSSPGQPVYLSYHDGPKRKLKYTWEFIRMPTSIVGVNTILPNQLVGHSIRAGKLEAFAGYDEIQPEVKVGQNHRLDLMATKKGAPPCYIEIKNCSLVIDGTACFPDAVTTRGRSHLIELQRLADLGYRAVIFFLINRMDAIAFKPADHIDPAYAAELRQARKNGVEIMCFDVSIELKNETKDGLNRISLRHPLPCIL
ncbi:MAG: DNA/RNA nuclease SfsA [Desulfobacteraceae bacterium]|nr:MAG: DNA/RNA nuclease SfsA [Desulfobacteraceae bacterium]